MSARPSILFVRFLPALLVFGVLSVAVAAGPGSSDPAWQEIDRVDVHERLAPGQRFGVMFDQSAASLQVMLNSDPLSSSARQAVNKAPTWLRKQLEDQFRLMSAEQQDKWSAEILDAVDPYVDETAFLIAHISRSDLANGSFFSELIAETAEYAYDVDSFLDYVEVVDYGNAADGGDYYTTVRYQIEMDGDVQSFEYDRSLYYWFILSPRGSDEFPTYIDPTACSSGGTPTAPPTGKFWRRWFFYGADNKEGGQCDTDQDGTIDGPCPVLKDLLDGVTVLWSHLDDTGGPSNGAIGMATEWVRQSLGKFGDEDGCRPVQPVLVYYHMDGNCGEWADLTMAAGRAALIPTEVTGTSLNDHVWNGFYDGWWDRWVQWEPVGPRINYSFENWWGGGPTVLSSDRGDGYTHSERTADHGGHSTLVVTVYDANHYPVDGAMVLLGAYWDAFPIVMEGGRGHTNAEGQVTFIVGDERDFFAQVQTEWGNYPTSGWEQVITNSVSGETYQWSPPDFAGAVPRLSLSGASSSGSDDDYLFEADYEISEGLVHGVSTHSSIAYTKIWAGNLDTFVVDDSNWNLFTSGSAFEAFESQLEDPGRTISFIPPEPLDYYVAWSNTAAMDMAHVIHGSVTLYENTGAVPGVFALLVDKAAAGESLLDWEDVTGQNVAGYNVYRSSMAEDVGMAQDETALSPFLLASPADSEYQDDDAASTGSCFFYTIRTRSSRGGISP